MLVLASASPRRAALLRAAGVGFVVEPTAADEAPLPGEDPPAYVRRVARAKAALATRTPALAADTTVALDGRVLGKPADVAEAIAMLGSLSGREHRVHTAVVLRTRAGRLTRVVTTRVWFRPLTAADIDRYVATGEPLDKAGGYGIQGVGGSLVERVVGSYTNVVGLPLRETLELLDRGGAR